MNSSSFFAILWLVALFWVASAFAAPSPTAETGPRLDWNHEILLDNQFRLCWNNLDQEWLTMEATVMGNSSFDYISLAFGPGHGSSLQNRASDKILVHFTNGKPHLVDGKGFELLKDKASSAAMRFKRKWIGNNFNFTDDTTRIQWEFGKFKFERLEIEGMKVLVGSSEVNSVHDRGLEPVASGISSVSLKVNNVNYIRLPTDEEDLQMQVRGYEEGEMKFWDAKTKNVINGETTLYLGGIVKFPGDSSRKRQIVGFRPLLEHPELIHHMVVFECHNLPPPNTSTTFNFFSDEMPSPWLKHCSQYLLGWSIGGEGVMLPPNTGLPIGAQNPYLLLQVHYDNPHGEAFEDTSGFRIYYVEEPRPDDSAFFFIEHRVTMFEIIPPGLRSYTTSAICTAECTRALFPTSGLTVTNVQMHAHQLATAMRVRHFREGRELEPLAIDEGYDPNYQEQRNVNPPRRVLPGDEFVVECEYDSRTRGSMTFGGIESAAEMCVAFLHYFPKTKGIRQDSCNSQPEFGTFFNALGVQAPEAPILRAAGFPVVAGNRSVAFPIPFDIPSMRRWTNSTGLGEVWNHVNVSESQTMADYLREFDWKTKGEQLQEKMYGRKYYAFCPGVLLDEFVTENPANLAKSVI